MGLAAGKEFERLPEVLRARDVANYLDIGLGKAYGLMRTNEIKSFRAGRCLRTTKKSLRNFIDERVA
jgi:hypothetical protein